MGQQIKEKTRPTELAGVNLVEHRRRVISRQSMARDGVGVIEAEKLKWSDLEQSKTEIKRLVESWY